MCRAISVLRIVEDRFMLALRNCASFMELRKILAQILVSSLSQSSYLATQVVNVCSANGRPKHATLAFNQVEEPNVFLYNAMIKAYCQNHLYLEAIHIYMQMLVCPQGQDPISPDRFTYPFVVKASGGLLDLDLGKQVHAHVIKSGLGSNCIIQNSLIEMYTCCNDMVLAKSLFDEMSDRDVVSWNTLISAHARLGQLRKAKVLLDTMPSKTVVSWTALISGYSSIRCYSDAIDVFREMQLEGFDPDDISIVSVLPACAQLGALELGKWIHAYSDKHAFLRKTSVCNALIEMYAKCGSIEQAIQLFHSMTERDVISWSTMIIGLAMHGRACEAIQLFSKMESDKRVMPNGITFLGLLSACSHAGLLKEGLGYFDIMKNIYGIDPSVEHYGCVVDLLGRSGRIGGALEFVDRMPIPPDVKIWGSLLGACRTHGDARTAAIAVEQLVELEPGDAGNYVMLSNIYASAGRWDCVTNTRKAIRSESMKKMPGCSLIEVDDLVQEFLSGDYSNPQFSEIAAMLQFLSFQFESVEIDTKVWPA